MRIFKINRHFFDFYTENAECKVYHIALYFHLLQISNSLGNGADWKVEFGLPTGDTMEALGIGNKKTYYATLRDLEKWNFLKIIKLSVNIFQATTVRMNFCECENEDLPSLISDTNNHANNHAMDYANNHAVVPITKPLKPKDLKTKTESNKKPLKVKEWFLFSETKYHNNLEVFGNDFLKKYPDYGKFLLSHYYAAMESWNKDSKAEKYKKKDWLVTAKNWIDADVEANKAKYSERSLNPQEKKDLPTLTAEQINAIRNI